MKKLIFILIFILMLIPFLILAQSVGKVGINVGENPTATLDIGGDLKVRNILNSEITSNTYILIVGEDGLVKKILLSSLFNPPATDSNCPTFIRAESNPYFIVFRAGGYLTNPNNPIIVNGLNFSSAGTYIKDNVYYYTYTNTSGQPLNINNFTANFGTSTCNYN